MLKTTAGLAVAGVIGIGLGYGASELLRPIAPSGVVTQTMTETQTVATTVTAVTPVEEKRYTSCTTAGPLFAYVKDGRIVRVEPLWYTEEEGRQAGLPWKIEAGGKTFSPPLKYPPGIWAAAARRWVYDPARGKYPLKRIDWNPDGERHPENRGKSDYVRISWEEAYDLIAKEIKRVDAKYGPSAILTYHSPHPEWGSLHYFFSDHQRFWNLTGGHSELTQVPNSWEGWIMGASFVYGFFWSMGSPMEKDVLIDIMQNSTQIVLWATDPITVGLYAGNQAAPYFTWFKELGKQIVAVNPNLSYTAFWADKWIPVIPGTDTALAMAIAHVWITEGTYDKEYLDTHAIGFDEKTLPAEAPAKGSFKSYILGEQDGVPKTPKWAEKICGVKAREIKALAREWASKPTCLCALWSGACRTAYDYEWARMMVTLQAMQGFGKPGVNMWSGRPGAPLDPRQQGLPGYGDGGMNLVANESYDQFKNSIPQVITDGYIDKAILDPPVRWRGASWAVTGGLDNAFIPYEYPMPGMSEVKMIYQRGSSNLHQKADLTTWIKVYQSPKIEFVCVQAPCFESDCTYADIYLPVNTPFERNDITEPGKVGAYAEPLMGGARLAVYTQKCIESLWESKTDMQIYTDLAERLGVKDAYTEGNTEDDWLRKLYAVGKIPLSYEEFKKKGYYLFPFPSDYMQTVYDPQLRWFYQKPAIESPKEGLATPTGKLEIFSTKLFEKYGFEDLKAGIAAIPKYRESWEGRNSHPLVDKYPLQLLTPHPRFRQHGKYDQIPWMRELYKVKGPDGYEHEPIYMNPVDAKARGLKDGDIVRVFNGRGHILCGVSLTAKVVPGAVTASYGSWPDFVERGTYGSLDRAGNSNILTPLRPPEGIQEHSVNQAWNSVLVQVERWVG
jgi:trimethylamine-N-oxide reductase (cytochrome c)